MKKILMFLFVITSSLILTNCKEKEKKAERKPYVIVARMSAQDAKDKLGIFIPDVFQYAGDEEPTAKSNGKGGKPKKKADEVTLSIAYSLHAEIVGGMLIGDVDPNALNAGGQKFVDTTTNDGAYGLWGCNRSYLSPPGEGVTTSCPVEGTGYYRVFSMDADYIVKLSWFQIQP